MTKIVSWCRRNAGIRLWEINSSQVKLRSGLDTTLLGKWKHFTESGRPWGTWISSPRCGFPDISWQPNANRRVVSGALTCFLPKRLELIWKSSTISNIIKTGCDLIVVYSHLCMLIMQCFQSDWSLGTPDLQNQCNDPTGAKEWPNQEWKNWKMPSRNTIDSWYNVTGDQNHQVWGSHIHTLSSDQHPERSLQRFFDIWEYSDIQLFIPNGLASPIPDKLQKLSFLNPTAPNASKSF